MQRSRQKRGQIGLVKAPPKLGLGKFEIFKKGNEGLGQLYGVFRATIGKRCAHLVPYPFIRVEFRRVGRQRLNTYALTPAQEGAHGFSFVAPTIIPDDDYEATQVLHKMPKKPGHFNVDEVGVSQTAEIQAYAVSLWADRKRRDDRYFLSFVMVMVDRGLTAKAPGATHRGDQKEAALVDEDNMGAQVFGVFFILGQSCCLHRLIRLSSRSNALRSGFWQLKPMPWRMRPTWSLSYVMPNIFSMISATRAVVHNSVRYPWAIAPLSNDRASLSFCLPLRREGRPGDVCTSYTPSPSRVRLSRQRNTELAGQPIWRATSLRLNPLSSSLSALRRRSERTSDDPIGRMLVSSSDTSILHYLCRKQ